MGTFPGPVWKPGDVGFAPHACPICGSVGSAEYMHEHLDEAHAGNGEALELLIADAVFRSRNTPRGVEYVSVVTPEQMARVEWDKLWPHEQVEQVANEYLYKACTPDLLRNLQDRINKAVGPGWRVHTDIDPSTLSVDPPPGYEDWLREQPPKNGPGPTQVLKFVPGVVS